MYPECKVTALTCGFFQSVPKPLPDNTILLPFTSIFHLPFPDNQMDLLYGLCTLRFIPYNKVVPILKEMWRVIKPGGYLEILQPDHQYHNSGPMGKIVEELTWDYLKSRGIRPEMISQLSELMKYVGFININILQARIAIGEWGAMRGRVMAKRVLGMTRNMADDLVHKGDIECGAYFNEMVDVWEEELPKCQVYTVYYSICAQRPPQ